MDPNKQTENLTVQNNPAPLDQSNLPVNSSRKNNKMILILVIIALLIVIFGVIGFVTTQINTNSDQQANTQMQNNNTADELQDGQSEDINDETDLAGLLEELAAADDALASELEALDSESEF